MRKLFFIFILMTALVSAYAQEYKASFFGIKSNGLTDNTATIQKAIDFISEKGGGTLVFYVGRYLTGAVELKSNVSITLKEGAVIVGSTNIYDYKGHKAIFYAEGQENIKLSGKGVIDGRGEALVEHFQAQKSKGYVSEEAVPLPVLIYFKNCKKISLETLLLRKPAVQDKLYIIEDSEVDVSDCYTDRY